MSGGVALRPLKRFAMQLADAGCGRPRAAATGHYLSFLGGLCQSMFTIIHLPSYFARCM